jgi:basic membrane protein A
MVVGPIGVVKENDLLWFGTQSSQADLAEGSGVAFQIYDWTDVLREMISLIQEGTLGGESLEINLENEGLVIEYGEYELSEELIALADETIAGIIDGSIEALPAEEMEPAPTEEAGG